MTTPKKEETKPGDKSGRDRELSPSPPKFPKYGPEAGPGIGSSDPWIGGGDEMGPPWPKGGSGAKPAQ
eukprot:12113546-Prorocentrum_lima.AAC.1